MARGGEGKAVRKEVRKEERSKGGRREERQEG